MAIYNGGSVVKGRVGSIVYRVRNGETIASQYQPNVANPSTPAQVQNRAKLKLLSQLGAAVEPAIAIPRVGAITPRNAFTKVNYQHTQYAGDVANIKLADMQFTDSAIGIDGFSADRTSGVKIVVVLNSDQSQSFDKVMYIICEKLDSGAIRVAASELCTDPGANGTFPAELPYFAGNISVHAYGLREMSAAAHAAFSNISAPAASQVAQLVATRKVSAGDVTLSETRGLYMAQGVNQAETTGVMYNRISVVQVNTAGEEISGAGQISGAGNYEQDAIVTLRCVMEEGWDFVGWKLSPNGQVVSSELEYQTVADQSKAIYACFAPEAQAITVTALPRQGYNPRNVTGTGAKEAGSEVTLEVAVAQGEETFGGWYDAASGGTKVSDNNPYTFTMGEESVTLYYQVTAG